MKNGGNDNDNGTSDGQAWATINRVHIAFNADVIGPGDSVLFKCGSKWGEHLIITKSGSESGGAIDWITIGAYGSGDRPIIGYDVNLTGATWTQYGTTDAYYTSQTSEVFIVNEYLPSNQIGVAPGYFRVYHQADDEDDCAATEGSFYWDNGSPGARLYIHPFEDSNPNSTSKEFYANTTGRVIRLFSEVDMENNGAVRTNGQSYIAFQNIHAVNQAYGIGGKKTHHIIVDSCRLSGNARGTHFGHQAASTRSTNLIAHDNDVRYNANGLRFFASDEIDVYNNIAAEHLYKIVGEDREAIAFFNCNDAEVYGNELWNNHVGVVSSSGPEISENFYVHHNYFHGDHERAIVFGGVSSYDNDVHIYHNLIWLGLEPFDDPTTGEGASPLGIGLGTTTTSTSEPMRVYNNTIHTMYGLRMGDVAVQINLDLKNNIFDGCKYHILDVDENIDDADPSHHIRDYNSFDTISADPIHKIMWDGVEYTDWETYRDIGSPGRNLKVHGNLGDPGFVDPPDDVRVEGDLEDVGECPADVVPFDCDTALDFYGQEIDGAVSIGAAEPPEDE